MRVFALQENLDDINYDCPRTQELIHKNQPERNGAPIPISSLCSIVADTRKIAQKRTELREAINTFRRSCDTSRWDHNPEVAAATAELFSDLDLHRRIPQLQVGDPGVQ